MNFRSGNYITSNLFDREFVEVAVIFFCIENCGFVLNHYRKLAPHLNLNPHFLLFINPFTSAFDRPTDPILLNFPEVRNFSTAVVLNLFF